VTRGRWVITIVLLVAVAMGIASRPLLRLRRKNEIYKAETLLQSLQGMCEQYRARNGSYPKSLEALEPQGRAIRDSWGRLIRYELDAKSGKPRFRSLGPNPDDPSDDLAAPR
jgi:type II secretory pathway pseudopilin PulG